MSDKCLSGIWLTYYIHSYILIKVNVFVCLCFCQKKFEERVNSSEYDIG